MCDSAAKVVASWPVAEEEAVVAGDPAAMVEAAKKGDMAVAQAAQGQGEEVGQRRLRSRDRAVMAARRQPGQDVQFLSDEGADANRGQGQGAMMMAAQRQHGARRILHENGAEVRRAEQQRVTALMLRRMQGKTARKF